jgi:hypothetical protein
LLAIIQKRSFLKSRRIPSQALELEAQIIDVAIGRRLELEFSTTGMK